MSVVKPLFKRRAFRIIIPIIIVAVIVIPVSYTHLDVYKRQGQDDGHSSSYCIIDSTASPLFLISNQPKTLFRLQIIKKNLSLTNDRNPTENGNGLSRISLGQTPRRISSFRQTPRKPLKCLHKTLLLPFFLIILFYQLYPNRLFRLVRFHTK